MLSDLKKISLFLVLLPLLAIPLFWVFDIFPWLLAYDEKRVAASFLLITIAVISACAAPVAREVSNVVATMPATVKTAIACMMILGVLTVIGSPYSLLALRELALYGLLLVLLLHVAAAFRVFGEQLVTVLVAVLVVMSVIYVFRALLEYLFQVLEGDIPETIQRAFNFSNVRFFNQTQAWTFPLLVFATLYRGFPPVLRKVAMISAVGWVMLALYGQGAGIAIAPMVGALAAISLLGWKACKPYFTRYGLIIVAGLIAHQAVFILFPVLLGLQQSQVGMIVSDVGLSGRDMLWVSAWQQFVSAPLLGSGPINLVMQSNNPHSALLQWLSEWGLISTFLVVSVLGWGLLKWTSAVKRQLLTTSEENKDMIIIALTVAMLSGLALSMVSAVIVTPFSQLLMAIVMGLALGKYQVLARQNVASTNLSYYGVRFASTVLAAVFLHGILLDVLDRYHTGNGLMVNYLDRHERGERLSPRFWMHGPFPHAESSYPVCFDFDAHHLDWICYGRLEAKRHEQSEFGAQASE